MEHDDSIHSGSLHPEVDPVVDMLVKESEKLKDLCGTLAGLKESVTPEIIEHSGYVKELMGTIKMTNDRLLDTMRKRLLKPIKLGSNGSNASIASVALSTDGERSLKKAEATQTSLEMNSATCIEIPAAVTETDELESSSKCRTIEGQERLFDTHIADLRPRDLETMHLMVMNRTLKMRNEQLEQDALVEAEKNDSSPNVILRNSVKIYDEILRELSDSFDLTNSRYFEKQKILKECVKIIETIESRKLNEDRPLTKNDLVEFAKKLTDYRNELTYLRVHIIDDRHKMAIAENQFHKIHSDYKLSLQELASVKMENAKMKTYIALLEEEKRLQYSEVEKGLEVREKKLNEVRAALILQNQKYLDDAKALVRAELERQEEIYEAKLSKLKNDTATITNGTQELMNLVERVHTESKTLRTEIQNLSEEQNRLKKLNNSLDDEIKLHREEYEALKRENTLMKSRSQLAHMDLDNFKSALAKAHKRIDQLQKENDELQESATSVNVYKIQIEEQERQLLQLFETERNYLKQIENLSIGK